MFLENFYDRCGHGSIGWPTAFQPLQLVHYSTLSGLGVLGVRNCEATGRGFADGVHKYASEGLVLVIQEMLVLSFVQGGGQVFLRWSSCMKLWKCELHGSPKYHLLARAIFSFPNSSGWRLSEHLRSGILLSRYDVEGAST